MQKIIAVFVLVAFAACSSSVPQQSTTPKPEPSPGEAVFVPVESEPEDLSKLYDYPAVPLLKDMPAPNNGLLYSPRHSAECSLDAAAANRLTIENKALSSLRAFENKAHGNYILQLETSLKKATEKTWWDENGGWIYLGSGALIGVITSIVIFAVAVDIKKQGD